MLQDCAGVYLPVFARLDTVMGEGSRLRASVHLPEEGANVFDPCLRTPFSTLIHAAVLLKRIDQGEMMQLSQPWQ